MGNLVIKIQHNGVVFSPPIKDDVQIEWERTESAGKLTFTTIKVSSGGMSFSEGDAVMVYYDGKAIFLGYVFTKKRDKNHHIEVTCYDQMRYLKNKLTYNFSKFTATKIIKQICEHNGVKVGSLENTSYVIPSLKKENISAMDIAMTALEETLLNTGNMYVLYDDVGKLTLKNTTNMISNTLIMESTAENFDYSTSIDDETYNSVVLYYKPKTENGKETGVVKTYTAQNEQRIKQWGVLRYFEEVDNESIGQNKAKSLLKLYCRKTRELKITSAFGDVSVRGGTLIPVQLNLGDIITNNYMLVEKVTHKFKNDYHTMDLTLEGAWDE